MNKSYTTDPYGNPALRSTRYYGGTEELPVIIGTGTVRRLALELAGAIISEARTLEGPVVWLTGNAYMPPLRSFPAAETIYQADNNRDGELFAYFAEVLETALEQESVYLSCPEYDNALYVVDMKRWQYRDDDPREQADGLNDEWERIEQ